jgi:RNA polymerase sigma-70 factor (ECF subfamily)
MERTPAERAVPVADDGGPGEKSLVARAREGDEEAFRELFEANAGLLEGRILRDLPEKLRRRVSVADVLQEVRIVAHRRLADFDPDRGPFRNWLLGIADMNVRSATRRHAGPARKAGRAEITRGARPDTANVAGPGPSPSEVAMTSELRDRLRGAVASLPEDYREVLRLTREEGLRLDETAERMGRSRAAVKKLVSRALCRLRREMRRLEGGADG